MYIVVQDSLRTYGNKGKTELPSVTFPSFSLIKKGEKTMAAASSTEQ